MKKLKKFDTFVNESIFAGLNNIESDEEWLNKVLENVNNISTYEELEQSVIDMTCGKHLPLNPTDPLRTTLRNKIESFLESETNEDNIEMLENYHRILEGEWKEIILPPGAMY